MSANILAQICQHKAEEVTRHKRETTVAELESQAQAAPPPRGFLAALQQQRPALIAEIKKASPSKGLIRADFDPTAHALAYRDGGAACLSVLTDQAYFQGHPDFLRQAKDAVQLPVLRKDFMIDPYQIIESRALGADCILLIMAALSDSQARELEALAHIHQMDVLIEVHDEDELRRALNCLTSPLVGINNRNLKTMQVDLNNSVQLRQLIPDQYTIVCESGIRQHDDIKRMQASDIHCFLVGESLMLQRNITEATHALLGHR